MKIPRKSSSSNRDSNSSSSSFLVQHATLILPYLTHTQLANISLTCKSLYKLTQIITLRRISDASRTFENYPIPFLNTNNPPYSYFLYTPSLILSHNTPNYQPWGAGEGAFVISDDGSVRFGVGCDFEGVCENGSVSFGVGCNFQGVCDDGSVGDGGGSSVISPIPPRTIHDVGLVRFGVGCENGKVGSGGMSSVISSMPPRTVDNDESVSFGVGCECEGICDVECMCFSDDGVDGIGRECGLGCLCGMECGNRVSQNGVNVRVKIVWCGGGKGWGLFANQVVRKEEFLFQYAGELLTTTEAQRRQQHYDELASRGRFSSALLVVREHLPSGKACLRLNIDATRIGNVARFVNHSCDGGNLSTKLVRSTGALFPRLCFFASKDIQKDEELAFSYGEIRKRSNGRLCHCNSPSCLGTLPSEDT